MTATRRPLLMIPGPIEVSPGVQKSFASPPPGHLAAPLIEAFGTSLERMREVWLADPASQSFVLAGSGTVAMDMAAANLVEPGDRVVVVVTGYFSDRMAEMLARLGAEVISVAAGPGEAPSAEQVAQALEDAAPVKALFATHVDTSTGVRIDPEPLARRAAEAGVLSVFDGVCATGAERFEMADWSADVYLTASQKAIGLPPGLALLVASPRALEARAARKSPPPMVLDWQQWLPIMRAYEERRPSYFSTPATNLILALEVGLGEILEHGMTARFAAHDRAARALRAAWEALELSTVPIDSGLCSNTLSALYYPDGVDASLVGHILAEGVVVAGGLHPAISARYFRVGHMGYSVTQPEILERTVRAVAAGLDTAGWKVDAAAAATALEEALAQPA